MAETDEKLITSLGIIKEQEKYLIRDTGEIGRVITSLGKRPDIITGYFNSGKQYILTSVVDVLKDRGIIVFDLGPDHALNKQLLQEGSMVCVTKHDRISIRFGVSTIQPARFQGRPALAAPLPSELFRLQRREYFRVQIPLMNPAICSYNSPDSDPLNFEARDISIGGIGLVSKSSLFTPEQYRNLESCTILLPEFESLEEVNLQIRNSHSIEQQSKRAPELIRFGCQYMDLQPNHRLILQRYIQRIQMDDITRER